MTIVHLLVLENTVRKIVKFDQIEHFGLSKKAAVVSNFCLMIGLQDFHDYSDLRSTQSEYPLINYLADWDGLHFVVLLHKMCLTRVICILKIEKFDKEIV